MIILEVEQNYLTTQKKTGVLSFFYIYFSLRIFITKLPPSPPITDSDQEQENNPFSDKNDKKVQNIQSHDHKIDKNLSARHKISSKKRRSPPARPNNRPLKMENQSTNPFGSDSEDEETKQNIGPTPKTKTVAAEEPIDAGNPFGNDEDFNSQDDLDETNPFADNNIIHNKNDDDNNDQTNPFADDMSSQEDELPNNQLENQPNDKNKNKFMSYDPNLNPFGATTFEESKKPEIPKKPNKLISKMGGSLKKKSKRQAPKPPVAVVKKVEAIEDKMDNDYNPFDDNVEEEKEEEVVVEEPQNQNEQITEPIKTPESQPIPKQRTQKPTASQRTPIGMTTNENIIVDQLNSSNLTKEDETDLPNSPNNIDQTNTAPKKFKNLRPNRRKKIELDISEQEKERENSKSKSDANGQWNTEINNDPDQRNRSQTKSSEGNFSLASNNSNISASRRRAPDAPVGKPRENDSNIDIQLVESRLELVSEELQDINQKINDLQPILEKMRSDLEKIEAEKSHTTSETKDKKSDKSEKPLKNPFAGAKQKAIENTEKQWNDLIIKTQNLTLEQSDLLLQKELFNLADKHSLIEHQIRVLTGKAIKDENDEGNLDQLMIKLSRVVNQKAALEEQLYGNKNGETASKITGSDDKISTKKKKGFKLKNPKKLINKITSKK